MAAFEFSPAPSLTDDALTGLVNAFYTRVRADEVLGQIFKIAIPDGHWPAHLERMAAFWSSVMLTSGRYHGNPMLAHLKHRDVIVPEMFARWLTLWAQTAHERLPPADADAILAKAQHIAKSLQFGLFDLSQHSQHAA